MFTLSYTARVFNLSDNADHINNFDDARGPLSYEGWNFNSGNYLFTTDTK